MKKKRYVGTYHSIDTVLAKITELKSLGYTKEEIFAVSNTEDNDRMLEDQTDIMLPTRERDGWLARMKFLFTDREPAKEAFDQLGFTEQQTQAFYNEVKDGGVGLFVLDDPDAPTHPDPAGERSRTASMTPRDSEGEMADSGIPLENAGDEATAEENAGRYPRINTTKL